MPSLLEEAIIEAGQLKEAATIQAKNEIINKYAEEIKKRTSFHLNEAVEDPMEEDPMEEDPMGDMSLEDDLGDGMDGLGGDGLEFEDDLEITDNAFGGTGMDGEDSSYLDDQVPMGFVDGDDEIEIDFTELVDMMDDSTSADMLDREDTAEDILNDEPAYEDDMDEFDALLKEIEEEMNISDDDDGDEEILNDEEEMLMEDDSEEDEDSVSRSSIKGTAAGRSPRPASELDKEYTKISLGHSYPDKPENKDVQMNTKMKDAKDYSSAKKDKVNKFDNKKIEKDLFKEHNAKINSLLETNNVIKSKNKVLYERLTEAKEVIDMLLVEHEKMKMQVEVLKNSRLNGLQKDKIVEAITRAKTVNEAQNIFELQNVTASKKEEKNPVREAINKLPRNSTRIKGVIREQEEGSEDRLVNEQWLKMAGIKKH